MKSNGMSVSLSLGKIVGSGNIKQLNVSKQLFAY